MKKKKIFIMGIMAIIIMFSNVNINALESTETKIIEPRAEVVYPATIESIFKDSELASLIATQIKKQPSDTIVKNDLASVIYVSTYNSNITSLEGIEELENLYSLQISQSNISDISNVDWSRLTKLEYLSLSNNSITDLGNTNLNEAPKLFSLSLYGNQIESISNVNFNGLTKLFYLDLSYNQISDLDGVDFSSLNTVDMLVLSSNKITNLDNADWNGLSSLKKLYLNGNQIENLDNANWNGLDSINELDISENNLSDLTNAKWPGNNTLNTINLAINKIDRLVNANLEGLSNVTTLNLTANKISTLDNMDWSSMNKLDILNISLNEISDLRKANLNQLSNLKTFYIAGNKINDLNNVKLEDLSNLMTVSFSGNGITDVSDVDWTKMPKLTSLDLMFNKISEVEMIDFTKLTSLKTLKLSYNQINHFEGVDFSQVPALEDVQMYGQEITLDKSEFKNQINVNNVIQDIDGSHIVPNIISNGGVYDALANSISWNLTEPVNKISFQWYKVLNNSSGSFMGGYSGTVTLPFANKYQVTFKDWDNTTISIDRIFEGDKITLPTNPTREGYTFNGWLNIDEVMPSNDVEYIATYTKASSPSVINVPAYTEIMQYSEFDLKTDVKAIDETGKDVTSELIVDQGNFDVSKPGFYTIRYSLPTKLKNKVEATRLILVNDSTYVSGDKFVIQATDFNVGLNNVDTSLEVLSNNAQVQVYDKTTGALVKENIIITSVGGFTNKEGVYQITFALVNELDTKITINATVESNPITEVHVKNSIKESNTTDNTKVNVQTLPTTGSDYLMISVQLIMLSLIIIGNRSLIKNK